jgi:hypothetical protein
MNWYRIIVWVVAGPNGGESGVSAWLPVIVGIIGVSGTLLGVAIGGLVSFFVKKTELSHQIKQDNRKLRITRLEELHERLLQLPAICTQMVVGFMHLKSSGSISRKELGEVITPPGLAFSKINSLLRIYAGELAADVNELGGSVSTLIDSCTKFLNEKTIASNSLVSFQKTVADKCFELAEQIQAKIQKEISG